MGTWRRNTHNYLRTVNRIEENTIVHVNYAPILKSLNIVNCQRNNNETAIKLPICKHVEI
jgi:hypothetical protein